MRKRKSFLSNKFHTQFPLSQSILSVFYVNLTIRWWLTRCENFLFYRRQFYTVEHQLAKVHPSSFSNPSGRIRRASHLSELISIAIDTFFTFTNLSIRIITPRWGEKIKRERLFQRRDRINKGRKNK